MAFHEQDSSLDRLEQDLNRLHRSIRLSIQGYLKPFEGTCYATLKENQLAASTIHQLLDRYGLRIRCPECGNPAILRVSARKNANAGVFVFDHSVKGKRTFHGGRGVFPFMRLVEKPRRKP
jgi:predicted RNA-binding Zn-ribbon protein involved in translation (DUF1610 family)